MPRCSGRPATHRGWPGVVSVSHLNELLQDRAEADAALAGQGGSFRHRAVVGIAAGKPDADLVAAEHRPLALARRVLMVDEFAFPSAFRGGVGAHVVEKSIAAAHLAVVEH